MERLRPKRPNKTLRGFEHKLFVPVPGALKGEVMRLCRERHVSQAELGLMIIQAAFRDEMWLESVLQQGGEK